MTTVPVARIVIPAWSASSSASSSSYSVNLSTTERMMRTRSSGSMSAHTPESKDSRAAPIARWASSRPPFGTVAMGSPLEGLITSKVSPEPASTHSPPM
jgi:hypothetical protein